MPRRENSAEHEVAAKAQTTVNPEYLIRARAPRQTAASATLMSDAHGEPHEEWRPSALPVNREFAQETGDPLSAVNHIREPRQAVVTDHLSSGVFRQIGVTHARAAFKEPIPNQAFHSRLHRPSNSGTDSRNLCTLSSSPDLAGTTFQLTPHAPVAAVS